MLGLNEQYLKVLFKDYCKGQIVGNVGWAYDMLREDILNRFSKEEVKQMAAWLNDEVEKYRQWMESIRAEDPEYYAQWHMYDLPIDRTNKTIQYRWKDRVVKALFNRLKETHSDLTIKTRSN